MYRQLKAVEDCMKGLGWEWEYMCPVDNGYCHVVGNVKTQWFLSAVYQWWDMPHLQSVILPDFESCLSKVIVATPTFRNPVRLVSQMCDYNYQFAVTISTWKLNENWRKTQMTLILVNIWLWSWNLQMFVVVAKWSAPVASASSIEFNWFLLGFLFVLNSSLFSQVWLKLCSS